MPVFNLNMQGNVSKILLSHIRIHTEEEFWAISQKENLEIEGKSNICHIVHNDITKHDLQFKFGIDLHHYDVLWGHQANLEL